MYLFMIHATQREPNLKKIIHSNLRMQVSFQLIILRRPNPPSALRIESSSHETLAPVEKPIVSCQRKELQRLVILFITHFGRRNVDIQKPVIPAITEDIRVSLPAIDKVFEVQDPNFLLIWKMSGS